MDYVGHLKRAIVALATFLALLRAILELVERLIDCEDDELTAWDARLDCLDPPAPPARGGNL